MLCNGDGLFEREGDTHIHPQWAFLDPTSPVSTLPFEGKAVENGWLSYNLEETGYLDLFQLSSTYDAEIPLIALGEDL